MRSILQLCLLVLMLLGAEKRAWSKVATSPQAAVRDWVQDSRLGGGIDAPPRQRTSGEAAAWDADMASAGDIHREDTLTMAGPVVVTSRGAAFLRCPGAAFLMCPGAPPPFIGSFRTTTPACVAYGPNVYAYVKQNPWTMWDPHGLSFWIKLGKCILKGGDFAMTVAGIVEDGKTFMHPNSTFGQRFGASFSILSEVLPASVGDVKDGYKWGKKALGYGDDAKDVAKQADNVKDSAQKIEQTSKAQNEAAEKLAKELEDRKQAALNKPAHGNTAGDQDASLYERYDKDGNFQKHGVAEDLDKRYSKKELDGGTLVEVDRGPRKEILKKEREKVETNPGPLNKEPWAGKQSTPPPATPTPTPKTPGP